MSNYETQQPARSTTQLTDKDHHRSFDRQMIEASDCSKAKHSGKTKNCSGFDAQSVPPQTTQNGQKSNITAKHQ